MNKRLAPLPSLPYSNSSERETNGASDEQRRCSGMVKLDAAAPSLLDDVDGDGDVALRLRRRRISILELLAMGWVNVTQLSGLSWADLLGV